MSHLSSDFQLEIQTGVTLGKGGFAIVKEITIISDSSNKLLSLMSSNHTNVDAVVDLTETEYDDSDNYSNLPPREGSLKCNLTGGFVAKLCHNHRHDAETTPYAVKSLRVNLKEERVVAGAMDLAAEAKLLSCLTHPNIVNLRGTLGTPGRPDFMLILDKLSCTLPTKLALWKLRKQSLLGRCLRGSRKKKVHFQNLVLEQLSAAHQIASAMEYLHETNIVYRDLKPENVGFNSHGNLQIFDFGLARALTEDDLVKGEEDSYHEYRCTGLTGTVRWMAPEVYLCSPYGYSADVFSFGLLFWSIFSHRIPFERMSKQKHFQQVIRKGKRPANLKHLSAPLHDMMTYCWHPNKMKRPSFSTISCLIAGRMDETSKWTNKS